MKNTSASFCFILLVSSACLGDVTATFLETDRIETVLVTGTMRDQNGSTIPLSWSEIDANALALTRHTHISELMQRVSGTWISRGSGQEHLTALRSPVLTGAGGCGSVYMAMDGIELRAPGFCNVNQLFDANSEQASEIEVIKGPATALYGSNAMHGVINILSVPPSKNKQQTLGFDIGGFGYTRARYRFQNGWDNQGLSLLANITSDEGFVDNTGFDQQKISARYDDTRGDWQTKTLIEYSNLKQETGGYVLGYKAYEDDARKRENPNPEAFRDASSFRGYSAISTYIDEHNELILTPYVRSNDMTFMMHFLPWKPIERNGHDSVGLRAHWINLGSGYNLSSRYELVSGMDVDYSKGWLSEIQHQPFSINQPEGAHYDYDVVATNSALFSQLSFFMTSRIVTEAGYRYEVMHYDYTNNLSNGSGCAPEASACRFFRPSNRTDSFKNGSMNLGISLQIADTHTGYFRVAQGFRAPQASELYRLQGGQESASLKSENMRSVEFGMRGSLGDRLSYDTSFYSMHKSNVIFQDANRFNVSGAKTQHEGMELSIEYNLLDKVLWSVDGTLAKHTYSNNANLFGVNTSIENNDVDTAPHYYGRTALAWQYQKESQAELEWAFMAPYFLDPQNQHEYAGHNVINLRVKHNVSKNVSASFRVTNLTNINYAERADYSFGNYQYFIGESRAFYVSLDVSF